MVDKELEEKAIEALNACFENNDTEVAHCDADDVLCNLLRELGYFKVVEQYSLVDKWYA